MSQFIEMFGSIQNGAQWPLRKLSEICTMVNGFAFKSSQYSNTGYSVIRIANVQKGYIDDSDRVYYPTDLEAVFSESILKEGDILISLTGNVGRVSLISEKHLPAALNQRVQGLRINDETLIDRDFLFNILNLDEFESLCIENSSGSAQLNLSTIWVREFPIICPAFEKQREFSKFAQQADKSGFDGLKSQFIEMFGNPVANNKGWNTLPIKDVAPEEPSLEKQTGKVWILNLDMIESNTCKIVGKVFEDDSNLLSVAPFDEGNVLYSKLRPYLNKVVIPDGKGYATTELVPLRPNQELLNLTFFSHLLRGDDFVTYCSSGR